MRYWRRVGWCQSLKAVFGGMAEHQILAGFGGDAVDIVGGEAEIFEVGLSVGAGVDAG